MYSIGLSEPDGLDAFREAARGLLAAEVEPADIVWTEIAETTLFTDPPPSLALVPSTSAVPAAVAGPHVPRSFLTLAEAVACHREPRRWSLLYRALWRITHGENRLLDVASDPLTHRLQRMAAAVKHDQHRMTAFLRFRATTDEHGDCFIAWYEPGHRILRRSAAFFIDRFASMRFSILTPDLSLHWDGRTETFCAGCHRQDMRWEDAIETRWQHYYAATFNPARVNPHLMARHMPKRFWRGLPEAAAMQSLLAGAAARVDQMINPTQRRS